MRYLYNKTTYEIVGKFPDGTAIAKNDTYFIKDTEEDKAIGEYWIDGSGDFQPIYILTVEEVGSTIQITSDEYEGEMTIAIFYQDDDEEDEVFKFKKKKVVNPSKDVRSLSISAPTCKSVVVEFIGTVIT